MSRGRIEDRLARRGGIEELLWLPALAFGAVGRARSWLYDRSLLPIRKVATPVVSVGNLTAGGTGKTPMVAWLVRYFAQRERLAGIASRGYKGAGSTGDEARMLAQLLPGTPQEQDPDRVAAAQRLVERGVDVIVLDDGFQHRRLHRDLDIVLVDASRPAGLAPAKPGARALRAPLPRGLLREGFGALARADAVVLTRTDAVSPEDLEALERELELRVPRLPRLHSRHAATRLIDPDGDAHAPSALAGRPWALLTGVGNPAAVERTVLALGAQLALHRARPDHHRWSAADLAPLAELGAVPWLTTAKDAPKLRELGAAFWTLEVELVLDSGQDGLLRLLEALPESTSRTERAAIHEGLHG